MPKKARLQISQQHSARHRRQEGNGMAQALRRIPQHLEAMAQIAAAHFAPVPAGSPGVLRSTWLPS